MLKKVNLILNIIMGAVVGVFIGHGIYVFWDFKTHPELYVVRSAPWYTDMLVSGIEAAAVLAIVLIVKLVIRHKAKQR